MSRSLHKANRKSQACHPKLFQDTPFIVDNGASFTFIAYSRVRWAFLLSPHSPLAIVR